MVARQVTLGNYELAVYLNADIESELITGIDNDSLLTSQTLIWHRLGLAIPTPIASPYWALCRLTMPAPAVAVAAGILFRAMTLKVAASDRIGPRRRRRLAKYGLPTRTVQAVVRLR